eukprot:s228_g1.t1
MEAVAPACLPVDWQRDPPDSIQQVCRDKLHTRVEPEASMEVGEAIGEQLSEATLRWFRLHYPQGPEEHERTLLSDAWVEVLCDVLCSSVADFGDSCDAWLEMVFLLWGEQWLPDIIAMFEDGVAERDVDDIFADFAVHLEGYQLLARIHKPPRIGSAHLPTYGASAVHDVYSYLHELVAARGLSLLVLSRDMAVSLEFGDLALGSESWNAVLQLYALGAVAATLVGSPCETFSEARFNVHDEQHSGSGNFYQQAALALGHHMAQGGFFDPSICKAQGQCKTQCVDQRLVGSAYGTAPLTHVSQYLWGATVIKPTGLLHYQMSQFKKVLYAHADLHARRPGNVAIGRDDTGAFKTSKHTEYPARFCKGLAATIVQAISMAQQQGNDLERQVVDLQGRLQQHEEAEDLQRRQYEFQVTRRWDAKMAAQQARRQLLLAELSASEDQQVHLHQQMGHLRSESEQLLRVQLEELSVEADALRSLNRERDELCEEAEARGREEEQQALQDQQLAQHFRERQQLALEKVRRAKAQSSVLRQQLGLPEPSAPAVPNVAERQVEVEVPEVLPEDPGDPAPGPSADQEEDSGYTREEWMDFFSEDAGGLEHGRIGCLGKGLRSPEHRGGYLGGQLKGCRDGSVHSADLRDTAELAGLPSRCGLSEALRRSSHRSSPFAYVLWDSLGAKLIFHPNGNKDASDGFCSIALRIPEGAQLSRVLYINHDAFGPNIVKQALEGYTNACRVIKPSSALRGTAADILVLGVKEIYQYGWASDPMLERLVFIDDAFLHLGAVEVAWRTFVAVVARGIFFSRDTEAYSLIS